MEIAITAAKAAAEPRQLAGQKFGIRAAAYLLDALVVNVLDFTGSFAGAVVPYIVLLAFTEQTQLPEMDLFSSLVLGFLLTLFYFVLCEWMFGATPGKLLLRLRVVMDDGSPCTFRAALIRAAVRLYDGLLFGLPAYLTMKAPEYKRAGDDLARTLVVRTSDLAPKRLRSKWRLVVALMVYMFLTGIVAGGYWLVRVVAG